MSAALISTIAAVASFAATAVYLAVSRGGWQRRAERAESHLVLLAHELAAYRAHVERQLDAQKITIAAYESIVDGADSGDPRDVLASLGMLPRPQADGDHADGTSDGVPTTAQPAEPPAATDVRGQWAGLLERGRRGGGR